MRSSSSRVARWDARLRELPVALGPVLRPWLPSLARVLHFGGRPDAAEMGQPNGFDGITRKGDMSRLVRSAWLLADEAPDEFVRRAASGELPFYSVARVEAQTPVQMVVLVDAGPAQLGAPRIAQLAALLVLADRARASGGRLRWGVLQRPGDGLRDGLDDEGVRAFLAARSARLADAEFVSAWEEQPAWAEHGGERWGLGAHGWALPRAAHVAITHPPFEETERLIVEAHPGAGGRRAALSLPLPDAATCARLIRDPFAAPAAATRAPGGAGILRGSSCWFSGDGRALIFRSRPGDIQIQPLRSSPRASLPKRKQLSPHGKERVLGATRLGHRLVALTVRPQGLRIYGFGTLQARTGHLFAEVEIAPRDLTLCLDADAAQLAQLVPVAGAPGWAFALRFARGHTFVVSHESAERWFAQRVGDTIALSGIPAERGHAGFVFAESAHRLRFDEGMRALVGSASVAADVTHLTGFVGSEWVALERIPGEFEMFPKAKPSAKRLINALPDMRVLGVYRGCLLVLSAGRDVAKIVGTTLASIYCHERVVHHFAIDESKGRAAMVDEEGSITVLSLSSGEIIDRIAGERGGE